MTVELVMLVARGEDDRLSGSIRLAQGGDARGFSGTLELMRVFEELVTVTADAGEPQAHASTDSPPLGRPV